MNRKGFTIIELVMAFGILALISGIAVVSYNAILNKSEEEYYHTIESNLLLSGNDYFQDNRDELPVSSYSMVPIRKLIDEHYINEITDKNGNTCEVDEEGLGEVYIYIGDNNRYEYEACLKCGNYASQTGKYCVNAKDLEENYAKIPTSSLCKGKSETTYTGSNITLTTITETEKYKLEGNVKKTANEEGYEIKAKIKDGYKWSDNTEEDKTFKCSLYKAVPNITLTQTEGVLVKGKEITFTEKSNVYGEFNNILSEKGIVGVSPEKSSDNTKSQKVTVTGEENGKTQIMIGFTPKDTTNYNTITSLSNGMKVYNVEVTEGIVKPTKEAYCEELTYTGVSQVLTKEALEGFTFINNTGTEAKTYTVTARLESNKRWQDGGKEDITIRCSIGKAIPELTISPKEVVIVEGGNTVVKVESEKEGAYRNSSSSVTTISVTPTIITNVSAKEEKEIRIGGSQSGEGEVTIKFTPSDTTNYESVTEKVSVKVLKKVEIPSTSTYCNNLTYTGSEQTLVKEAGEGFEYIGSIKGKNAGKYQIIAKLEEGYRWKDGTETNKIIECVINKKSPTVTINPESARVAEGKTTTITEKSEVAGTFTNTSSNQNVVKVSPATNSNVGANTEKTETITGEKAGTATITIRFTPSDTTNYEVVERTVSVTIICKAGDYLTSSGTCSACAEGTYSAEGATRCTQCEAGTYASGTGNTSCTECSGNTYSAAGAASCIQCNGTVNTTHTSCTECRAGTYWNGTTCTQCQAGTYASGTGNTSCTPCSGNTYSAAGATSCSSCGSGTEANSSHTGCDTVQTEETWCPAGQYLSGGSCYYCQAGTYSTAGSTRCTQCPAGTYASGTGNTSCTPCSGNTYSAAGASRCSSCGSGETANSTHTRCDSSSSGGSGGTTTPTCGTNQTWNGSSCVCNSNYYGTNCDIYCGGTYDHWVNNQCIRCTSTQTWNGSSCVDPAPTCGANQTWNGSSCVDETPACTWSNWTSYQSGLSSCSGTPKNTATTEYYCGVGSYCRNQTYTCTCGNGETYNGTCSQGCRSYDEWSGIETPEETCNRIEQDCISFCSSRSGVVTNSCSPNSYTKYNIVTRTCS